MNDELWKLTNAQHQTYGGCQWGPGVTHRASGGGRFCGPGWIHAYTSPRLAVLLNPIHAGFSSPVLWRAEGVVGKRDHGLKVGCINLTTLEIVEAPVYSREQTIAFAIFCGQAVYRRPVCPVWSYWADGWLSGANRSKAAAQAAAGAAEAMVQAAMVQAAVVHAAVAQAAVAQAAARAAAWAAVLAALAAPLDLDALALCALKWQP